MERSNAERLTALTALTAYGSVIGSDESSANGTLVWRGVPYARPPIGDLRWRAPLPPEPWQQPRNAQQFANPSVQTGRMYGPGRNNRHDRSIGEMLGKVSGSEDSLTLNIWAPAAANDSLPVIVFIHGGSNITGYTADPLYDGAALAVAANAVVVTVNYRLGIFGFLNLPQVKTGTDAASDSGNFALLDILAALRFVQHNIANFGGDPGKVTLMGQSAGAVNIWALLTSPLLIDANPALIHRVMPISGGLAMAADLPPGRVPVLHPAEVHEAQGRALLEHALIAADEASAPADIAAWLRALSAESLLTTVFERLSPLGLAGSGPIPDGVVVPRAPMAAIHAGRYLKVPVLAGFTREEGKLFAGALATSPLLGGQSGRLLSDAQVFAFQFEYDADAPAPTTRIEDWIPPSLLPVTKPGTGFNARIAQLDQLLFLPNRDVLMNALRAQQDEVWFYQFDWDEEPPPFNDIYGAAHGFDVPFLFGNFGPSMFSTVMNTRSNQSGRLALSQAMMKSVAAFAWHGNPGHAGLGMQWPHWPALLHFDASPTETTLSVST